MDLNALLKLVDLFSNDGQGLIKIDMWREQHQIMIVLFVELVFASDVREAEVHSFGRSLAEFMSTKPVNGYLQPEEWLTW